jgi:hypothetical protein
LLPAEVFTEGSPAKQALKRRVSSLEAVAHDLFEENQDLQEPLEHEAKKRAEEVRGKFYFKQKRIFENDQPSPRPTELRFSQGRL